MLRAARHVNPGHSTDPGPSVETVQDAFSAKSVASLAGEIFDPFLDYNVALFTADIDHYLRRADALGMPTSRHLAIHAVLISVLVLVLSFSSEETASRSRSRSAARSSSWSSWPCPPQRSPRGPPRRWCSSSA